MVWGNQNPCRTQQKGNGTRTGIWDCKQSASPGSIVEKQSACVGSCSQNNYRIFKHPWQEQKQQPFAEVKREDDDKKKSEDWNWYQD